MPQYQHPSAVDTQLARPVSKKSTQKTVEFEKAVEKAFFTYPYRRHLKKLPPEQLLALSHFHCRQFFTEPHAFALTDQCVIAQLADASLAKQATGALMGLGSIKPFALLSAILAQPAYILKDFMLTAEFLGKQPAPNPTQQQDNSFLHQLFAATQKISANKQALYPHSSPATLTEYAYELIWQNMFAHLVQQAGMPAFVAARLPVENLPAINVLLKNGFNYIANETIYSLTLPKEGKLPAILADDLSRVDNAKENNPSFSFRLAHGQDAQALMNLVARTTFPTRYQLDEHFSPPTVERIYQETLQQSLSLPNHYVCICEVKNKNTAKPVPIAFISFIVNHHLNTIMGAPWGSLDYIIVDKAYRKSGLATLLNSWAIKFLACLDVRLIQVKTLAHNYASTALLSRSGFKLAASNVLLHYHSPASACK